MSLSECILQYQLLLKNLTAAWNLLATLFLREHKWRYVTCVHNKISERQQDVFAGPTVANHAILMI